MALLFISDIASLDLFNAKQLIQYCFQELNAEHMIVFCSGTESSVQLDRTK